MYNLNNLNIKLIEIFKIVDHLETLGKINTKLFFLIIIAMDFRRATDRLSSMKTNQLSSADHII